MKPSKVFAKKINQRFSKKQDEMQRQPGIMGGGDNVLKVPGLTNFIYVTINDKTVSVYNVRVSAKIGIKVWVGYSPEEPHLFQVLSTRSDTPAGGMQVGGGFAPSGYYEWMRKGLGQDPLHVHLRAFSPLKIGVSNTGGLNVEMFGGVIYSGTEYIRVLKQDVDMTSFIPSTADKCKLVMVSIDNTGAVVTTAGTEIDKTAYDPETSITTDLPAIPADTVFVSGAVRVYTGQAVFRETHTNTDFIDLRFSGLSGGTITPSVSDHALLSNLNSTTYYHLTQAEYTDLTDGGTTTLHAHAGGSAVFDRTLDADLTMADNASLVVAEYIDAGAFTITLTGDAAIALIGGGTYPIRTLSITSSATPTINTDLYDVVEITAQAADITSMTTNLSGTPVRNQQLQIYITGTGTRAITWGSGFESGMTTLPTTTTSTQTLEVAFRRNGVTNKWRCQAAGSA